MMKCNGSEMCIYQWSKESGIDYSTLAYRVKKWGAGCAAVTTPVDPVRSANGRRGARKLAAMKRALRIRIPSKRDRR